MDAVKIWLMIGAGISLFFLLLFAIKWLDGDIVRTAHTTSRDSSVRITATQLGPNVGMDYNGKIGFSAGGGIQINP